MGIHSKHVNGNLVFYHDREDKWLDAIGKTVRKYFEDFIGPAVSGVDNSDPVGWTMTAITGDAGDATWTIANADGGAFILTPDDTENDGVNVTWNSEAFLFAAGSPTYFGIRLKLDDADQCDLFVGMTITDTGLWGGVTDGVYFNSADETAACTGLAELNSSASTPGEGDGTGSGTFVDDTYSTLEFFYNGDGSIAFYFDDVLIDTASTASDIPIDEALTFALEILTGEAVTNFVTVDWIRVIQCQ